MKTKEIKYSELLKMLKSSMEKWLTNRTKTEKGAIYKSVNLSVYRLCQRGSQYSIYNKTNAEDVHTNSNITTK